jgi:hypothetical protein
MENIYATTILSSSIQFLETLYILENSKNIETIQNRIDFLETVTNRLRNSSNNPEYRNITQQAVDNYKVRYINRILSEKDLTRLNNLENFDLESYSFKVILTGLQKYIDEQHDEIVSVKNRSSKERRISKVMNTTLMVRNFIQMKYSKSKSYTEEISILEKITDKIKEINNSI